MSNSITKQLNTVIDKVVEELDLIVEHNYGQNNDEVVCKIYQTLNEVLESLQKIIYYKGFNNVSNN